MADKKDPTVCVTCNTELPPGTRIHYFTQGPMCPTKDDLGFGDEIGLLLDAMKALFDVIGHSEIEDDETVKTLGQLGYETADETIRRMQLLSEAQNILWKRCEALQQQLSKKEG